MHACIWFWFNLQFCANNGSLHVLILFISLHSWCWIGGCHRNLDKLAITNYCLQDTLGVIHKKIMAMSPPQRSITHKEASRTSNCVVETNAQICATTKWGRITNTKHIACIKCAHLHVLYKSAHWPDTCPHDALKRSGKNQWLSFKLYNNKERRERKKQMQSIIMFNDQQKQKKENVERNATWLQVQHVQHVHQVHMSMRIFSVVRFTLFWSKANTLTMNRSDQVVGYSEYNGHFVQRTSH